MTEAADMDYQAVALRKISPHLLDKRAAIASIAAIGMQAKFTWLKRSVKVKGAYEYEGFVHVHSNLPPKDALITFANWYFHNQWFAGSIRVILYPAGPGAAGRDKPFIPLLAFQTNDGHKSLHVGGKLCLPCVSNLPEFMGSESLYADWELVEANYRELYLSCCNQIYK